MSNTYTIITLRSGMVYPVVVHGANSAENAAMELWRLGQGYEVIATIEGEHVVRAPHYGIAYSISLPEKEARP